MACTGESMGMRFGLEGSDAIPKRKFRWLFKISGVSAEDSPAGGQARALPPKRGARPSLSWKEYECQHLNETIYYPFKPDWKPVQLHLYDINCTTNPVFDWIRLTQNLAQGGLYDPQSGNWTPIVDAEFKREGKLLMLDGCGTTLEEWTFENCYPQNVEWGELDMDSSDVVTVDLTLRYDRAYIAIGDPGGPGPGGPGGGPGPGGAGAGAGGAGTGGDITPGSINATFPPINATFPPINATF